MKKIGLLLAASLLSLSLVACGGSSGTESKMSDGSTGTTETEANLEESKSEEKKKGHGQNPEDYEGTVKEIYGLSYEDNYINLLDCTTSDLIWFFQQAGISGIESTRLGRTVGPYYSDSDVTAYNPLNIGDIDIGAWIFNPKGEEIYYGEGKVEELHIPIKEESCAIKVLNLTLDEMNELSLNGFFEANDLEIKRTNGNIVIEIPLDMGQTGTFWFDDESVGWSLPQLIE